MQLMGDCGQSKKKQLLEIGTKPPLFVCNSNRLSLKINTSAHFYSHIAKYAPVPRLHVYVIRYMYMYPIGLIIIIIALLK